MAVVSNVVDLSVTSSKKRLSAAFFNTKRRVSEVELKAVRFAPSGAKINDALISEMQTQPLSYLAQENILVTADAKTISGRERAKRNNVVRTESTK